MTAEFGRDALIASITTSSSRPFAFAPGEESPDAGNRPRVLGVSIVTARNSIEAAARLWRGRLKNHPRSPRAHRGFTIDNIFYRECRCDFGDPFYPNPGLIAH